MRSFVKCSQNKEKEAKMKKHWLCSAALLLLASAVAASTNIIASYRNLSCSTAKSMAAEYTHCKQEIREYNR